MQRAEQFVFLPRPRMRRRPEQAVMDEKQVRLSGNGKFHGRQTGIHGRGDARDGAAIRHLQAIRGAVVIADRGGAEQDVAVLDEGGEGGCLFHW